MDVAAVCRGLARFPAAVHVTMVTGYYNNKPSRQFRQGVMF